MDLVEDPLWRRVASSRPALRMQVRVQHRDGRGGARFLLCDDIRRRFHHVDPLAWQFVGRLDGRVTVEEAWQATYAGQGEQAPTQTEAIRMLQRLASAGVLTLDAFGQADTVARQRQQRRSKLRAAAANPLSFKVPLFDPQPLLDRAGLLARALVSPFTALAWALLMVLAAAILLRSGEPLLGSLATLASQPDFLLQMWLVYPVAKLLHESAHALALRAWGGEVRECGINLVLLTPLPFVDASAASGLPSRRRRILVSAMGMAVELALAALALLVWSATPSPELRQWALAVVTSCGVSTIVFNLNPLARFDGYYILSDLLDLPNLGSRGRAMLGWHFQRLCAGPAAGLRPEPNPRDAGLLSLHAALSWLWNVAVVVGLALWLSTDWPALALLVLVASTVGLLWRPLGFAARFLLTDPRLAGRRSAPLLLSVLALALPLLVTVAPLPSSTVVPGVVWPAPDSLVRSGIAGDVVAVLAQDGQAVSRGQPLAVLDNLELRSTHATALARRQALDVRLGELLLTDPLEATKTAQELESTLSALNRLDAQLAELVVRADADGRLAWPRHGLHPGDPVRQGQELGFVLPEARPVRIKLALSEPLAARLATGVTRVDAVLDPAHAQPVRATLERDTPAASHTLAVPALAETAGGPVRMDPADPTGQRTLAPVVMVDVLVDTTTTTANATTSPAAQDNARRPFGGRAWVRLHHRPEPLLERWWRALRQAFLQQLGADR